MKNPSTFILRVNDTVQIHVHAVGKITTEQPTNWWANITWIFRSRRVVLPSSK